MFKTSLAVLSVALLSLTVSGCGDTDPEKGCKSSGGTVIQSQCCRGTPEFPDTCLIGACGCSSESSALLRVCSCPEGQCFDGSECVSR
jgi:hypothetical protein